jgi:hypothetical protein
MSKQTVSLGTAPTGTGGDTPRSAFTKIQSNMDELYAALGGAGSPVALPAALPISAGGTGAITQPLAQAALGLVPTTTQTDKTAGRLLKVGDYGIGGSLVLYTGSIDDTSAVPFGKCYPTSAATGTKPAGAQLQGLLDTWGYTGDAVHQEWTDVSGGAGQTLPQYCRDKYATNAWGPWRPKYHAGNAVGTVSQISGAATGAIFEIGSNANGKYTKFMTGLMICEGLIPTLTVAANVPTSFTQALPATYIDGTFLTSVVATPDGNNNQSGIVCTYAASTSSFGYVHLNGPTAQHMVNGRYVAVGRWF